MQQSGSKNLYTTTIYLLHQFLFSCGMSLTIEKLAGQELDDIPLYHSSLWPFAIMN